MPNIGNLRKGTEGFWQMYAGSDLGGVAFADYFIDPEDKMGASQLEA